MEEIYSKNGLYKRYNSEKGMIVIKKYRDKYKMTWHKCLRLKGYKEIASSYILAFARITLLASFFSGFSRFTSTGFKLYE